MCADNSFSVSTFIFIFKFAEISTVNKSNTTSYVNILMLCISRSNKNISDFISYTVITGKIYVLLLEYYVT